ncbi:3-hydroxyacyl-CoA dehydrogenase NAD-binding protein [Natrialba taiwanensis DSM 12281]|uniref:3-hydroxyacyl-CoA dehydrogenase NAD-binding protein n=1 Tax=Natrialba taiwanensis DSM 12281 TaxID=1230458 RepID=M0AAF0_9EURY|nr:3-hydroxyacyl-CoA dehydrogenase NAD-binding protein [Natrialba taiwanensis DSM 12281]
MVTVVGGVKTLPADDTVMSFDSIDRVAVLGAGNMGHGIAEVTAMGGYEVTMRDIEQELVDDGYEQIAWSLDKLEEKDRLDCSDRKSVV